MTDIEGHKKFKKNKKITLYLKDGIESFLITEQQEQ